MGACAFPRPHPCAAWWMGIHACASTREHVQALASGFPGRRGLSAWQPSTAAPWSPQGPSAGSARTGSAGFGTTSAWPAARSPTTASAASRTWRTSAPPGPRSGRCHPLPCPCPYSRPYCLHSFHIFIPLPTHILIPGPVPIHPLFLARGRIPILIPLPSSSQSISSPSHCYNHPQTHLAPSHPTPILIPIHLLPNVISIPLSSPILTPSLSPLQLHPISSPFPSWFPSLLSPIPLALSSCSPILLHKTP